MDEPHSSHDDAPKDHDHRDEDRRSETLEKDLSQRFEDGIRDKENGEREVVLGARHMEVFRQAVNFRIPDIGSIKERCQIQ